MLMIHVAEIGAGNRYQKTGTINRHENRVYYPIRYRKPVLEKFGTRRMSDAPETGTGFLVPVFGADFLYVCH